MKILSRVTVILIGICLVQTFMLPGEAQETRRTISVTGEGVENIATTRARVQLGVEVQGTDAAAVQREVATRTNVVVNFLRSRSVEKLQTTGISLQPNYDFSNNQRRLIGYTATNLVSFQLDIDRVGDLLDRSVGVGATRIDSISFTATDEAIATAQRAALVKAAGQARQQANTVLQSLGFSPKDIVNIQIGNAATPAPLPRSEATFKSADAPSPVIGGEQTVRAFVTLQITY